MTLPRAHQPNPQTTPLHRATEAGDLLTVQQMLTQGYSPNMTDRDGKTPLHWVSVAEVAKVLIDAGSEISAVNHGGYRALHSAARRGCLAVVKLLLKHGAAVNATAGHYRLTPLHLAVDNEHEAVAELLLAHGADPRAMDWIGNSPADVAAERGHTRIIELLSPRVHRPDVVRKDFRMLTIG